MIIILFCYFCNCIIWWFVRNCNWLFLLVYIIQARNLLNLHSAYCNFSCKICYRLTFWICCCKSRIYKRSTVIDKYSIIISIYIYIRINQFCLFCCCNTIQVFNIYPCTERITYILLTCCIRRNISCSIFIRLIKFFFSFCFISNSRIFHNFTIWWVTIVQSNLSFNKLLNMECIC